MPPDRMKKEEILKTLSGGIVLQIDGEMQNILRHIIREELRREFDIRSRMENERRISENCMRDGIPREWANRSVESTNREDYD